MNKSASRELAFQLIYSTQIQKNMVEEQFELCINGFKTEFENMKICSLNNENSVKCFEYFNSEDNFIIIMELCDTNLSKVLTDRILKNGKGFY